MEDNTELLTLTADIAAAYVSNNTVQASDDDMEKLEAGAMTEAGLKVDRRVPRGRVPRRGRAHVHHHGLRPVLLRDDLQVLLGVHHHDVGGAERGGVDQRQQPLLQAAAANPAVLGRPGRADQVVEDNRHVAAARVKQPRGG